MIEQGQMCQSIGELEDSLQMISSAFLAFNPLIIFPCK